MDLYGKLKAMDVLIIDDDPWIRDALVTFFGIEGVRCATAGTIGEGTWEVRKKKFGVIFCSFWLEGMDGLAFLRSSRTSQPDAVMILVAPFVPAGVLEELKEEPFVRLLQKPIRIEAMETIIREELSRRRPAIMAPAPDHEGTNAGGKRTTQGRRRPLPREDTLRLISQSLEYSRKQGKRQKGQEGGPAHEEEGAKAIAGERNRFRHLRKRGGEG